MLLLSFRVGLYVVGQRLASEAKRRRPKPVKTLAEFLTILAFLDFELMARNVLMRTIFRTFKGDGRSLDEFSLPSNFNLL